MKYFFNTCLLFLMFFLSVHATEPDMEGRYVDGQRAFTVANYDLAFEIWLPLAEQGFVKAQSNVAHLYSSGIGVEKDKYKAVYWLEKAVEGNDLQAKYNLADYYRVGDNVEKDITKAETLFREAIDGGFKYGLIGLLKMYRDNEILPQNENEEVYWNDQMILLTDSKKRNELLWLSDERNY